MLIEVHRSLEGLLKTASARAKRSEPRPNNSMVRSSADTRTQFTCGPFTTCKFVAHEGMHLLIRLVSEAPHGFSRIVTRASSFQNLHILLCAAAAQDRTVTVDACAAPETHYPAQSPTTIAPHLYFLLCLVHFQTFILHGARACSQSAFSNTNSPDMFTFVMPYGDVSNRPSTRDDDVMSSMHSKHLMHTCSLHRAFSCTSHFRVCVCRSACTRRVFLEHDWVHKQSSTLWHHPLNGLRIFSITLFLCSVTCTHFFKTCVCVCVCVCVYNMCYV